MRGLHLPSFAGQEGPAIGGTATPEPPPSPAPLRREETPAAAADNPFVLGEALPAVPAKLVRRILKPEYIDMAELLHDNIEVGGEVAGRGNTLPGALLGAREIPISSVGCNVSAHMQQWSHRSTHARRVSKHDHARSCWLTRQP